MAGGAQYQCLSGRDVPMIIYRPIVPIAFICSATLLHRWGDRMSHQTAGRDLVVGVSPCGEPNARLVAAVCAGGGLGVLDLAQGDRWARQSLELAAAWVRGAFGVRVQAG